MNGDKQVLEAFAVHPPRRRSTFVNRLKEALQCAWPYPSSRFAFPVEAITAYMILPADISSNNTHSTLYLEIGTVAFYHSIAYAAILCAQASRMRALCSPARRVPCNAKYHNLWKFCSKEGFCTVMPLKRYFMLQC